jgi:hypothetical protein
VRETGTGILSGNGGDQHISIVASQTDFTSPSGARTLTSTSSANFIGSTAGTQTTFGELDSTPTPNAIFSVLGGFLIRSTGATGNPLGYSLETSTDITLNGGNGASGQFTNNVQFAGAVVPEPASIAMMLIGMPLALVVLGLVRRRAAA